MCVCVDVNSQPFTHERAKSKVDTSYHVNQALIPVFAVILDRSHVCLCSIYWNIITDSST